MKQKRTGKIKKGDIGNGYQITESYRHRKANLPSTTTTPALLCSEMYLHASGVFVEYIPVDYLVQDSVSVYLMTVCACVCV